MLFELGYVMGLGGYKVVAFDTRLGEIFIKATKPLYRWSRWHLLLLENGLCIFYPTKGQKSNCHGVGVGENTDIWKVVQRLGLHPYPVKVQSPEVLALLASTTGVLEQDLRKIPPEQLKDVPETVHFLGGDLEWHPLEMTSQLGVAIDIETNELVLPKAPIGPDPYPAWLASRV